MKRSLLLMALAIALGAPLGASAADHAKTSKPAKPAVVEKAKTKKLKAIKKLHRQAAVTGSYIKRDYRQFGVITDGPSPLYILNATTIARSGGADLSQVLIRAGFRR